MIATIVLYAGLVLLLISLIMILKHGWDRNRLWAFAMLLLPVLAFVHIGLQWKELQMRKAFYLLLLGVATAGVGIFGGGLANVPYLPQLPAVETIKESTVPDQAPLPNEEQANAVKLPDGEDYDPILTGSEFESADIEPLAPSEDKTLSGVKLVERNLRPIDLDMAPFIIKRQVQLHLTTGQTVAGTLVMVSEEGLVLDQSGAQGTVEFTYVFPKIGSAEALLSDAEYSTARSSLQLEQVSQDVPVQNPDLDAVVPAQNPLPSATNQPVHDDSEEAGNESTGETLPTDTSVQELE